MTEFARSWSLFPLTYLQSYVYFSRSEDNWKRQLRTYKSSESKFRKNIYKYTCNLGREREINYEFFVSL